MGQYITIAEFAKLAGVSRQAIYSRLDSQELSSFIQVDNSKKRPIKLVNTNALPLFNAQVVNQVDNKELSSSLQQLDYLKEQLQSKDQTIEALLDQVKQLQEQNNTLSSSLIEQGKEMTRLLDQQQQLQQTQQVLYARLQAPAIDQEDNQEQGQEQPPQKKRFWEKLFSR